MVYLENRRFLPLDSALRAQIHGFPTQNVEIKKAPRYRNFSVVRRHHKAVTEAAQRYVNRCMTL